MTKKEAIDTLRQLYSDANAKNKAALECLIPELAESKDEIIRKELIQYLKDYPTNLPNGQYTRADFFAYLEKQKEQAFTHHEIDESLRDAVTHQMEDDGDVDDFVRRGIDDTVLKYAELGARWQKEQKPIVYNKETYTTAKEKAWMHYSSLIDKFSHKELFDKLFFEGYCFGIHEEKPYTWTTHDEYVRKEAIACLKEWKEHYPGIGGADYINILDWLTNTLTIHLNEIQDIKQKPAEWNEVDTLTLDSIISIVEDWESEQSAAEKEYYGATQKSYFIKALPERFNLQPKQEWSEEDKRLLELWLDIIDRNDWRMDENFCKASREFINRLISLRPSWKPSEE